MSAALLTFLLHQLQKKMFVAQCLLHRSPCPFLEAAPDSGQVQFLQVLVQLRGDVALLAHCIAPLLNRSSKLASDTSATATWVAGGTLDSRASIASTVSL